jgi:hypothetical protein
MIMEPSGARAAVPCTVAAHLDPDARQVGELGRGCLLTRLQRRQRCGRGCCDRRLGCQVSPHLQAGRRWQQAGRACSAGGGGTQSPGPVWGRTWVSASASAASAIAAAASGTSRRQATEAAASSIRARVLTSRRPRHPAGAAAGGASSGGDTSATRACASNPFRSTPPARAACWRGGAGGWAAALSVTPCLLSSVPRPRSRRKNRRTARMTVPASTRDCWPTIGARSHTAEAKRASRGEFLARGRLGPAEQLGGRLVLSGFAAVEGCRCYSTWKQCTQTITWHKHDSKRT